MTYLLEIKDVNDIIWYVRPKHIKHIQQRSKTTVIRLSEKARVKNNVIVLDKSAWEVIGPLRELQNRR